MPKRKPALDELEPTPELASVLSAIKQVLAGRVIHHDYLPDISHAVQDSVKLHRVSIIHRPKGTLNNRRAFYNISIQGPRIDGAWNLTPGTIMDLIGTAETDDAAGK